MQSDLTRSQNDVYEFMVSHFISTHQFPTRQEIANRFSFNSPNAAQFFVKILEQKGYLIRIERESSRKRYKFAHLSVVAA